MSERIEKHDSVARADKKFSIVRLEHRRNIAVWQALILSEIREPLSVIPGQTLRGAKPHKAARIADDAIDRVVSQTLLGRKDSEVRMLRQRISGARNNN